MILRFNAIILQNKGMAAAYVEVPCDIKEIISRIKAPVACRGGFDSVLQAPDIRAGTSA